MSDEPGVINIDDRRPHVHGHAMCLDCKREWMAVAPESTAKMECPNCHSMGGRFLGDSRDCKRCNYEKLVLRERAALEEFDRQQWQAQGKDLAKEVDQLRKRAFDLAAENGELKQRIADLEAERAALMAEKQSTCGWYEDGEDSDVYQSQCGMTWQLNDGGPAENLMTFCHGCGKRIDIQSEAENEK